MSIVNENGVIPALDCDNLLSSRHVKSKPQARRTETVIGLSRGKPLSYEEAQMEHHELDSMQDYEDKCYEEGLMDTDKMVEICSCGDKDCDGLCWESIRKPHTNEIVEILYLNDVFANEYKSPRKTAIEELAQEINALMSDEYSRGYVDGVTWGSGELKRGLT